MSQYDKHQIPVAYPPPQVGMEMEATANANQQGQGQGQGTANMVPPVGYPTKDDHATVPQKFDTQSRGDGFWKGCCAALCCCCVLEACF